VGVWGWRQIEGMGQGWVGLQRDWGGVADGKVGVAKWGPKQRAGIK
jgi:hypothetical protein